MQSINESIILAILRGICLEIFHILPRKIRRLIVSEDRIVVAAPTAIRSPPNPQLKINRTITTTSNTTNDQSRLAQKTFPSHRAPESFINHLLVMSRI